MATTYYLSGISLIVQYLTNLGLLAQGATLNTYVGGTVSTPVTTYTDSTGGSANANPMTLNAGGRPATPSGALAAFWVPGGTSVKLVVTDAAGNQLVNLDNVPAINDLTNSTNSLQALLASASSSNASGSGPVAGADLVANAVKSYDVFSDVRNANAPALVTGQTLSIEVQGGTIVDDGLGGPFYWSPTSLATDDNRTVLRPNSVASGSAGRWLRLYPLGAPQIIAKAADQSVSSTVLTNDTALAIALLGGGTYLIQLRLRLIGVSTTGQGYQVGTVFSGSIPGLSAGGGVASSNGTAAAAITTIGSNIAESAVSSTAGDFVNLDFVITIGTAGTLTVQFAQNSSSANAVTMKAGSSLIATRLS
jgi:hypothetical protein